MDSFQAGALKLDQACAKLRRQKLHKLGCLFRVMEIALFLIFLWRNILLNSPQFPVTLKFLTGEGFQELLLTLSSPRVVFLIGNAIVLILFADSRQYLASAELKPKLDFYAEYTHNCAKRLTEKEKTSAKEKMIQVDCPEQDSQKLRTYKRGKSEKIAVKKRKAELRRSATESCRQLISAAGEAGEEEEGGEKGMSDDEFRDMVEAFIARQQRNLREE
uniref:DUF4408 domain-containing protein n=1 Tax=Kalanchoe fedtschenkoi TaxID=63787 RepID=A0A7N0T270_KALFE